MKVFGRLYSETEAAMILGLSPRTLQRWRWAGGGPEYIKLGSCVRYPEETLATFLDRGRRASTSCTPARRP